MKDRFNFIHNRHTCSLLALIFMYNILVLYNIYESLDDSQKNYKNISGDPKQRILDEYMIDHLPDPNPHSGPVDQDPYPFQPNKKINFFPENFNKLSKILKLADSFDTDEKKMSTDTAVRNNKKNHIYQHNQNLGRIRIRIGLSK
jgi:hypothetical protein